jgi:hypothetical protein
MYKLTYCLNDVTQHETFAEAFLELYNRLNEDMENGMSWQALETTIWIEKEGLLGILPFYEARDLACDIGILKDGKWNPDFKDPEKDLQTITKDLAIKIAEMMMDKEDA